METVTFKCQAVLSCTRSIRPVAGFVLSGGSNSGPSLPIPTFSPITPLIFAPPLKQLRFSGVVLLGERFKAPSAGSGAEPQPLTILVHF